MQGVESIRVIYRIRGSRIEVVQIIAIGARDKGRVFDIAAKRLDSGS